MVAALNNYNIYQDKHLNQRNIAGKRKNIYLSSKTFIQQKHAYEATEARQLQNKSARNNEACLVVVEADL
jgi:hypothetical protein